MYLEFINPSLSLEIECHSIKISQVLLNLLNNAYDAIQNQKEKWIKVEIIERQHEIDLIVTDSGNGIPVSVQKRMMQPFFTTKDIGKGTGLGLSISQGIVTSHHGKINIDNASMNTRFVITLPKRQRLNVA